MGGVARAVGCEQGVWPPFGDDLVEGYGSGAPDDLEALAKLAQDVVFDSAIQRSESRQWVAVVVLSPGVEQDGILSGHRGHQVVGVGWGHLPQRLLHLGGPVLGTEDAQHCSVLAHPAGKRACVDPLNSRDAVSCEEIVHAADRVTVVGDLHQLLAHNATRVDTRGLGDSREYAVVTQ